MDDFVGGPPFLGELVDVLNGTVSECTRLISQLDQKNKELHKNHRKLEHDLSSRIISLEQIVTSQNKQIDSLSTELVALRKSAANVGAVQTWVKETELRNRAAIKKLSERIDSNKHQVLSSLENNILKEINNIKMSINTSQSSVYHQDFLLDDSAAVSVVDGNSSVTSITPSVNQTLLEDLAVRCARLLQNTRKQAGLQS